LRPTRRRAAAHQSLIWLAAFQATDVGHPRAWVRVPVSGFFADEVLPLTQTPPWWSCEYTHTGSGVGGVLCGGVGATFPRRAVPVREFLRTPFRRSSACCLDIPRSVPAATRTVRGGVCNCKRRGLGSLLSRRSVDPEALFRRRLQELVREKFGSLDRFYLETDFSKGHLSQILRGKRSPSLSTIVKLANALEVQVGDFFRPTTEPERRRRT
jgi:helix-turn-helix protein